MGEISLVCPGCAAEYRVPESAIPAEGREVECSNCGRVWLAEPPENRPKPLDLASLERSATTDDDPPPPDSETDPAPSNPATAGSDQLSRRLPDSVFNILRDEVEHEKRVRAATSAQRSGSGAAASTAGANPQSDTDWPATTVTTTWLRAAIPPPTPLTQPPSPEQVPASGSLHQTEPRHPAGPRPPAREVPARDRTPVSPHDDDHRAPTPVRRADIQRAAPRSAEPLATEASHHPRREQRAGSGYRAGFTLGLLLVMALLALYVAAPSLAERGGAAARLIELREGVDKARLWMQQQVTSVFDQD
jgi:predicted Zn finger-like uncharacterized protein